MSAAIENSCHRLERLLSCGVPDLKFDDFAVDEKTIAAEFYPNCDLMLLLEFVVHDSLHQA